MALGNTTNYPGNVPAVDYAQQFNQTPLNFTSVIDYASTGAPNLPDVYGGLMKVFGKRSLARFLEMTSAEYPTDSKTYTWAEEGRLHIRFEGVTRSAATSAVFNVGTGDKHVIRVGATVNVSDAAGVEGRGVVTSVAITGTSNTFTLGSYKAASSGTSDAGFPSLATTGIVARVTGSEFGKGTAGMDASVESNFTERSVDQIIIKDNFEVAGSDVAQIGWINPVDENGNTSGMPLWFHQSEMDTRQRYHDYLESELLEAVPAVSGSAAATAGLSGTDGYFYTLEQRGNVFVGGFDNTTAAMGLADFDILVRQLDKQGAIEENMLFLNKDESLAIDDILSLQSNNAGTASWGVFQNNRDMGLNLGFREWMRGSYSFYKTDWKYLNDEVGRQGIIEGGTAGENIQGTLVPGGSGSIYEGGGDGVLKRPYLHVKYRMKGAENRKMKTWVTGSVGGVYTDDNDAMRINYLSERSLCTVGANNFFLFKRA